MNMPQIANTFWPQKCHLRGMLFGWGTPTATRMRHLEWFVRPHQTGHGILNDIVAIFLPKVFTSQQQLNMGECVNGFT